MPQAAQGREGRTRNWRKRWMALLFLLAPGVLVVGLIAPDLVKMAPADEHVVAAEPKPWFRPGPLRKTPLLVPRDFSAGFTPELLDLQNLFSRAPYAPTPGQLSRMVTFPQNTGELIALDEVDEQIREVMFKDVLAAALTPTPVRQERGFLPLGDPLPRGNGFRYDDFPGPGNGAAELAVPIPEPDTALLLGGGLVLLGLARRRRA